MLEYNFLREATIVCRRKRLLSVLFVNNTYNFFLVSEW